MANFTQGEAAGYAPVETPSGVAFIDTSLTGKSHLIDFEGQTPPGRFEFFDPNGKGLLMSRLILWVEKAGPLAAGPGRSVWRYSRGVWHPDGESEIVRRVGLLLGDSYRKAHSQSVIETFSHREQFIGTGNDLFGKINTANGVVDWRTGQLSPHSPEYAFTWQLPVNWNPTSSSKTFDAWLHEVFPGTTLDGHSPGHRLAYEILGYALLGRNLLHKAVILQGAGRNGKGTFLRVLDGLLGTENTSAVSIQSLASDKYSTAEMFGKLANIMGDLDASSIRHTDRLKQLTGGDVIYAQRKYQQPFKFTATAFPIFAANELPRPQSDFTEGFFSRWVIVPFDKGYFPEGKADPFIEDQLLAELEGILGNAARAIKDLAERQAFTQVEEVTASTKGYRVQADPVLSFIEDRIRPVQVTERAWVSRPEVYTAYQFWAEANGGKALSARKFYERFARQYRFRFDIGLATSKRQSQGYLSIAILPEEETIDAMGSQTLGDLMAEAEVIGLR